MAEKTKIQDTKDSGFGQYDTANGGGTPQGGKFGGPNGRVGWKKRGEPGHRESQPRTKDGKFTYNSVNGKPLAETSNPKRGETVNPLLTGGENGVKIKDVESQFSSKSGSYWDKYKDSWYRNASESTGTNTRGKIGVKVAAEPIWEIARHSYDVKKGELGGESENWKAKAGARSKEAQAAIQKQEATGKEQFVEEQADKSIKTGKQPLKQSTITPVWRRKAAPAAQSAPTPTPQPSAPTPQPSAPQGPAPQAGYLQAPQAATPAQGQGGLSQANMAAMNALFGGQAPANVTGTQAPTAPAGPSLAGFQNFIKNKK